MKIAYDRIANDPRFAELVRRRNRFSLTLSIIVLGVYITFVSIAIFNPDLFSMPVIGGSKWAFGLLAGFAIQAFAFVMTGIYTRRANGEFDAIAKSVIAGAEA